VQTIRRWWFSMGLQRYPQAKLLVITAAGGGSNGHRVRLWKLELSCLAQEVGPDIQVHHFPPCTSKWNKIEYRLFSFITVNWRGQPLVSHEIIVNLIASTKTRSGLRVRAGPDTPKTPRSWSSPMQLYRQSTSNAPPSTVTGTIAFARDDLFNLKINNS